MTRRKPRTDQPLLPPRDTVRTQSDLDREVAEWAKDARREPMDGQQVLPIVDTKPKGA
jgi:hypothetical protein